MTSGWLETYRGVVYRWEVDHNDHLTVAYYFARLEDAGRLLLDALGGGRAAAGTGQGWVTVDGYARYRRELRVGDVMHVTSGVVAVEPEALVLGHRLVDSGDGELCTTFEQRVRRVGLDDHAPLPLPAATRQAAEARRVAWDGPPRERRPRPRGLDGFAPAARDVVGPADVNVEGTAGLAAYIHRFSAANGHALARLGLTPAYHRDARRGFSTFEFQCTFTGPLRAGTAVGVHSGLLHVGTSSMRVFHVMQEEGTGRRVATLDQLGVHLDMDARRPTPLPDDLRARAKALLAPTDP